MKSAMNARKWLIFGAMMLLPVLFQNCGNGGFLRLEDIGSLESSSYDAFFDYPYSAKPDYFVNVQLVQPAGAAKFSSFVVFASVTSAANGAEAMPYELRVRNGAVNVCPPQMGTLAGGVTSVQMNCSPASVPAVLTVEFVVTPSGQATRTYSYSF